MAPDTVDTAFDAAYQAHFPGLYRYVYRLVDDATIADELTQDAFVRALAGWDQFRGEASVKTWLYRIARNTTFDYLRSPRHRDRIASLAKPSGDEPRTVHASAKPGSSVADIAQQAEMTDCVRQFIAELPETLRTPLILHDLEGLTSAEIADVLSCSLAAAKMRLHRARRMTEEMVLDRCDLFHDERDVLSCLPAAPLRSNTTDPDPVRDGPAPRRPTGRTK